MPIAFASNSMNKAQRNYCTTKRELLAVVVYTKKFRHFSMGRRFHFKNRSFCLKVAAQF